MSCKRSNGFTLIELMVVIAILAVLLALGLPSFQGSMRSNRVATATNELIASVSLARSEALRSGNGGGGVCASSTGTACDGTSWSDGWIVWTDADAGGDKDATEPVVKYIQARPTLTMTATATGTGSALLIPFDARGRVRDATVRTLTLKPSQCTAGTPLVRQFAVRQSGQLGVSKGDCT